MKAKQLVYHRFFLIALSAVVIMICIAWYKASPAVVKPESETLAGGIRPAQAVELAFGEPGVVGLVNKLPGDKVNAGEIIASLDNAKLRADMRQTQAQLKTETAKLTELQSATGTVDMEQVAAALTQARVEMLELLLSAATSTKDAIYNKADEMFVGATSTNPQALYIASTTSELSVESGRIEVEHRLMHIDSLLRDATTTSDQ